MLKFFANSPSTSRTFASIDNSTQARRIVDFEALQGTVVDTDVTVLQNDFPASKVGKRRLVRPHRRVVAPG